MSETLAPSNVKPTETRQHTALERAILADWYQETLRRFLGTQEAVDAFTAEVFTQARKAPQLYHCTIESTRFTIARVASLHLNPALPNEVFLIPRNNKQKDGTYALEMTHQYGYGGLRKLALRSPEVQDCFTEAVCANDTFVPPLTPVDLPLHRLPGAFKPRGRVIGYYAVVQLTNGHWRFWPMSVQEVQEHAKRYVPDLSRAPAWHKGVRPDVDDGLTSFDKMAMKTCLRMLLNGRDVPLSDAIQQALDDEPLLMVPAAAEQQGYVRDGQTFTRPVIAMHAEETPTVDDLLRDIAGDTRETQEALADARRGGKKAAQTAQASPEPWCDDGNTAGHDPDACPAHARAGGEFETSAPGKTLDTSQVGITQKRRGSGGQTQAALGEPAWKQTLRAHRDAIGQMAVPGVYDEDARARLDTLAEAMDFALSPLGTTTDAEGLRLAAAVLEWIEAAKERG